MNLVNGREAAKAVKDQILTEKIINVFCLEQFGLEKLKKTAILAMSNKNLIMEHHYLSEAKLTALKKGRWGEFRLGELKRMLDLVNKEIEKRKLDV